MPDLDESEFLKSVGARLRRMRLQRDMSPIEVEILSNGEVSASLLSAYERAEQAISIDRLQRLAEIFAVPVDELLPSTRDDPGRRAPASMPYPIRIDLEMLAAIDSPERDVILQFVTSIQTRRDVFTEGGVTIREGDLATLGERLGIGPAEMESRLVQLGLYS